MKLKIDQTKLLAEQAELSLFASQPDAFNQPDFAQKMRRLNELNELLDLIKQDERLSTQRGESLELLSGDDKELAELAEQELAEIDQQIKQIQAQLAKMLMPTDPNDDKMRLWKFALGLVAMRLGYSRLSFTEHIYVTLSNTIFVPN